MAVIAVILSLLALFMAQWYVVTYEQWYITDFGSEEYYYFGPIRSEVIVIDIEDNVTNDVIIIPTSYGTDSYLDLTGWPALIAHFSSVVIGLGIGLAGLFLGYCVINASDVNWRWREYFKDTYGFIGQMAFWFTLAGILVFMIALPMAVEDRIHGYESTSLGIGLLFGLVACAAIYSAAFIASKAAGIGTFPVSNLIRVLKKRTE